MKIIIPLPCSFGPHGGWRVLSELANHWILQGHQVLFLAHKSSDIPYFPTIATILWFDNNGLIHEINDINYKRPVSSYFGISYSLIKALKNKAVILS